ncbi:MAG: threonyl-tRNA synthetase [Gaiellales bacterium]|jgi:threonyl-tRNA synthetase|nr:threonyl-tRNA synthetase [Gaiellales bacterium]
MKVELPDGTALDLENGATGLDAATAIGPRLGKAAVAVGVDGEVRDLRLPLSEGEQIRVITDRDAEALGVLRHSTAHVMAEAVLHLWPGTKVAIGPAIADGFYYDFEFEQPISAEDLERIEAEMRRILASEHPFERTDGVDKAELVERFEAENQPYKLEMAQNLPDGEISLYTQDDFEDLCRGPHLQTTKPIKAFKLLSTAGAYWRGDSNNTMLTRIYGTAFFSQKDLDEHLQRLEEARKRDHRRLGRELDLFHFSDVSPGSPFWHPNGMVIWNELSELWRELNRERGYREVKTPILFNVEVWKRSGHWDVYRENMYFTEVEQGQFGIKPMNCPGHVNIYADGRRSYRDLPLRLAEQGLVHRHEPSGTLHGLLRVRHITQDDAHIFCTHDQIEDEVIGCLELAQTIYDIFGLDLHIELSTRPEKRIGSDELWDEAEGALERALARAGVEYQLNEGDGAFYGPKIDLHMTDSIGRPWQMGTIQLDYQMPERFEISYTGEDNAEHRPAMIHRALFGSFERFIGILVEHYGGAFPVWLAPVQVKVVPVADRHSERATEVAEGLTRAGLRAEPDLRNESVGKKIAESEHLRIPCILVIGDREVESGEVSVRRRGQGNLGSMPLAQIRDELLDEARSRASG